LLVGACGGAAPSKPAAKPSIEQPKKLIVLPAESAMFPDAARAATGFLSRARVRGLGEPQLSKVSLEVVQISIECVEPSPACYVAVGRSLAANQLLFAELTRGKEGEQLRVTVTLFDVDSAAPRRSAIKMFATELDAAYGIRDVVEEATRL
jgi:hypothetical protein